jgi:glycosyltransferase involved in cell wall biosynthesis
MSCTYSDGTSVSLLEAMATGLPCIVTDNPSNQEWVIAGENGCLGKPGDAEDFGKKLLWLANLPTEALQKISQKNRRFIEQNADWDKNFSMLLQAFSYLSDGFH